MSLLRYHKPRYEILNLSRTSTMKANIDLINRNNNIKKLHYKLFDSHLIFILSGYREWIFTSLTQFALFPTLLISFFGKNI